MKKKFEKLKESLFEWVEMAVVFGGLFLLIGGLYTLAESVK